MMEKWSVYIVTVEIKNLLVQCNCLTLLDCTIPVIEVVFNCCGYGGVGRKCCKI